MKMGLISFCLLHETIEMQYLCISVSNICDGKRIYRLITGLTISGIVYVPKKIRKFTFFEFTLHMHIEMNGICW